MKQWTAEKEKRGEPFKIYLSLSWEGEKGGGGKKAKFHISRRGETGGGEVKIHAVLPFH